MIHKDFIVLGLPDPTLPISPSTKKSTPPPTANPFTVVTKHRPHHPQRVRGHDPQGLCRSRTPGLYLTYIAIDEEVDTASHCQPIRRPIEYQSFTVVQSAVLNVDPTTPREFEEMICKESAILGSDSIEQDEDDLGPIRAPS